MNDQDADAALLRAAFDAGVYAGGMADPRVTEAYLDEQFAAWLRREATVAFLVDQGVPLERALFETRDDLFFDQPAPIDAAGNATFRIAKAET